MVTIYLADITTINDFNLVWDAWVPPETAPSRAFVEAKVKVRGYLGLIKKSGIYPDF